MFEYAALTHLLGKLKRGFCDRARLPSFSYNWLLALKMSTVLFCRTWDNRKILAQTLEDFT